MFLNEVTMLAVAAQVVPLALLVMPNLTCQLLFSSVA